MVKIERTSYLDLFTEIGDPETERKEIESQLVTVATPFPLNRGKTNNITCHKSIAEGLLDALIEVERVFGLKLIQEVGLDEYNGCYNHRRTRSGKYWSGHAFGVSADFCSRFAGYGQISMIPYQFVNAFLKRGFYWGGNWRKPYTDGMHFSRFDG